jgi:hypothetical protein
VPHLARNSAHQPIALARGVLRPGSPQREPACYKLPRPFGKRGEHAVQRRIGLLYVSMLLAFFVAPLDNYLGSIGLLPIRATVLFVLGFAPVLLIACLRWVRSGMRLGDPSDLLASNSQLMLAFAFLALVSLLWNLHPDVVAAGIEPSAVRLYGLINLGAALALAGAGLREQDVGNVLLPALLVMLATMYADFVAPGTFSVDGYRAAGVAQNSNVAGSVVVLIAAASLSYARVRLRDVLLLVTTGAGVVWTSSRAALLMFGVLALFWTQRCFSLGTLRRRAPWLGIATLVGTILFVAFASYSVRIGEAYSWFASRRQRTIFAVEGPETLLWSMDRARCAQYSLDALPGHWILGRGTGFTRTLVMGPHNLFLEQWVSNGLPGLLALCWLLAVGLIAAARRRSPTAQATMVVLSLECLFSHNMLDERAPLLILGLVMGVSAAPIAARRRVARWNADQATLPDDARIAGQPA